MTNALGPWRSGRRGRLQPQQMQQDDNATTEVVEPPARRARTVVRVDELDVKPMDLEPGHSFEEHSAFAFAFEQANLDDLEQRDFTEDVVDTNGIDDSCLWRVYSALEPVLTDHELAEIDIIADKIEIQRLFKLNVFAAPES